MSEAVETRHGQPATERSVPGAGERPPEPSGLFGRGLLYVVVWVLQVASASIVSPVLAHLLGPREFGALSTAIAVHQVLMVVAVVGLDRALIVRRAEDGDDVAARGLVALSLLTSGVLTVVVLVTSPAWSPGLGFGHTSSLVVATVLWTAPAAVVQVALALLLSQDRFRAFTVVSLLSAVGGQVFGLGLLVGHDASAGVYAWGGVVSQVAAAVLGCVLARPRWRGLLDTPAVRRALRFGAPLMISGLSVFLLDAGDRIVIQRALGAEQVGRYQIAYTVGYVVVLLVVSTGSAWTPRIAALRDEAARWRMTGSSRDQLYLLLVPVVLGVTLGAPVVLRVVAPSSFDAGTLVPVTFLVALSAFPVAASGASGRLLLSQHRTRALAVCAVLAAAVNVGLNLLLVPRWGITAAAAVTWVSFAVQAGGQRLALSAGPAYPRTRLRTWVVVGLGCLLAAASLSAPDTAPVRWIGFAAAAGCLPWFAARLRTVRRGEIAGELS